MNHYLANIAARNIQNDTHSLIPAIPAPPDFEGGTEEVDSDNFQQNDFVETNSGNIKPGEIEPMRSADLNIKPAFPLPEKNQAASYFTKHTERISNLETSIALNSNLLKKEEVIIEEPSKRVVAIPEQIKIAKNQPLDTEEMDSQKSSKKVAIVQERKFFYDNEPSFIYKTDSKSQSIQKNERKQTTNKTVPESDEPIELKKPLNEQKRFIVPSIESTQKINNLKRDIAGVEYITPNKSDRQNSSLVRNKKETLAPQLTIGKIIVEILPPPTKIPPKIITKYVPSTSNQGQSKSNKLIFGLGQM